MWAINPIGMDAVTFHLCTSETFVGVGVRGSEPPFRTPFPTCIFVCRLLGFFFLSSSCPPGVRPPAPFFPHLPPVPSWNLQYFLGSHPPPRLSFLGFFGGEGDAMPHPTPLRSHPSVSVSIPSGEAETPLRGVGTRSWGRVEIVALREYKKWGREPGGPREH